MAAKTSDWRPGPTVCRCCFADGCYKDISTEYFWMGKREVYSEMLLETFDVSIAYAQTSGPNSNSRLICEPCISRLRDASDFKRQVQECEKVFLQHLAEPGSSLEFEILPETSQKEEVKLELERVKIEAKVDNDDDFDDHLGFDDDDDDDMDDEPLTKFASKVPKEESDDLMNILLDDETKKPEKRKSSTKVKLTVKKTKKKESPKPSASKASTKPVAEKKKKGLIEISDSTLVLKDEAGQDIRLAILRTPIDLGSLNVVYEENENKQTDMEINKTPRKAKIKAYSKIKKNAKSNGEAVECKANIKKQKKKFINKPQIYKERRTRKKINKSVVGRSVVENSLRGEVIKESDKIKTQSKVAFLQNPIPLNIQWNQDISDTSNTKEKIKETTNKNIRIKEYGLVLKKKRNKSELEPWKRNALIIFENSFVSPFIYVSSKYKCFVCAIQFIDANELRKHTIIDHNIEEMRKELTNRVRDKDLKVDVSCLQCKICMERTSNLQNLKIHLLQHGKQIDMAIPDSLIPFKLGGNVFECQICGEQFLKLRVLIIHMSKHYNNYSCDICGSAFISLKLLRRHLQVHDTGEYPCQSCDKVFSSSSKRSIHYRGVHLKKFPRICPMCPERFNSNYQRTKHLRVVHNQTTGLFRCETCFKEYDLKCHLLVHIRSVHLQERKHPCRVCKSRFFSKSSLDRHMLAHEGEKIYKCQYCEKVYARQNCLLEHTKTHEGLAIYVETVDDVVSSLMKRDNIAPSDLI